MGLKIEHQLKDLIMETRDKGNSSQREVWVIKANNMIHHPTQPAVQWTDGNWVWYWMNRPHRWDGPAMLWNGRYKYFIHGNELCKESWEKNHLRLKWLRDQRNMI